MRIIIASKRTPKIEGAKRAIARAAELFAVGSESIILESREAASRVDVTPRSLDELLAGARNRAVSIFPGTPATLTVGVEGGLYRVHDAVFLQSWACVYDGTRLSYGASGSIQLPVALNRAVMDEGKDLGEVIDSFAGAGNVRSRQGTWGVLTNDAVSREDSFDAAVFNALMPLWNDDVYGRQMKR